MYMHGHEKSDKTSKTKKIKNFQLEEDVIMKF